MAMSFYYLGPGMTDLMHIRWIKQIREDNEETKKSRKEYKHGETCLHGEDPISIVQGRGLEGVYWKRCDGRFLNALGAQLDVGQVTNDDDSARDVLEPLDFSNEYEEKKVAEMVWRRRNSLEEDLDDEEEIKPKRRFHCMVM